MGLRGALLTTMGTLAILEVAAILFIEIVAKLRILLSWYVMIMN
jgi:hypothetical protein